MASSSNTNSGAQTGGHIALGRCLFPSPHRLSLTVIVGGIVFQFVAVVVYMLLTTEFLIRFALKKPFSRREETLNDARIAVLDSKTKQMIFGVGLSSLAMFIRYVPPSPSPLPQELTDPVQVVSTVPSNCLTAGTAESYLLSVTLVSRIHSPYSSVN